MFAWEPSDLPAVPREVIEHELAVDTDARPMKQVIRKQGKEKQDFILSEVDKLKKARVIRVVPHPMWVSNPVVVPKPHSDKRRVCIDFTDLNKSCPKDPVPLPQIWLDHVL